MISYGRLRRYPLFGALNEEQLRAIAMISREKEFAKDEVIFGENAEAAKMYLVVDGDVDLFYGGGEVRLSTPL
ncbi:MAG: cyclic nucleotide-binding domain-containing protein [Chloroflexota bacterium]